MKIINPLRTALALALVAWLAGVVEPLAAQTGGGQGQGQGQGREGAKKPKNGKGIKWSSLKLCTRKVKLSNDAEIEVPVTWRAWPGGPWVFVGYTVELEKVGDEKPKTIKVWVLPVDPPEGVDEDRWERGRYWCHGLTFDDNLYSPGGNEVPKILEAGWDEFDWSDGMAKGEIIVYFNADDSVAHTAVSNGDGTFSTKNGQNAESDDTKADLDRLYNPEGKGSTKCYREKPKKQPRKEPKKALAAAARGGPRTAVEPKTFGDPERAQFHPVSPDPCSGGATLVCRRGSGEMLYLGPEPLLVAEDFEEVAVVDDRANLPSEVDTQGFHVEVLLSPSGVGKLADYLATRPVGQPLALAWRSEVFATYELFPPPVAGFVVAARLEEPDAIALAEALAGDQPVVFLH